VVRGPWWPGGAGRVGGGGGGGGGGRGVASFARTQVTLLQWCAAVSSLRLQRLPLSAGAGAAADAALSSHRHAGWAVAACPHWASLQDAADAAADAAVAAHGDALVPPAASASSSVQRRVAGIGESTRRLRAILSPLGPAASAMSGDRELLTPAEQQLQQPWDSGAAPPFSKLETQLVEVLGAWAESVPAGAGVGGRGGATSGAAAVLVGPAAAVLPALQPLVALPRHRVAVLVLPGLGDHPAASSLLSLAATHTASGAEPAPPSVVAAAAASTVGGAEFRWRVAALATLGWRAVAIDPAALLSASTAGAKLQYLSSRGLPLP